MDNKDEKQRLSDIQHSIGVIWNSIRHMERFQTSMEVRMNDFDEIPSLRKRIEELEIKIKKRE